jgi:hypothetical protein
MAILMEAMVDSHLQSYLLFRMRPDLSNDEVDRLTGSEGLIGTLSRKIVLAWVFDLIGPITRDDLDHIRQIRNEFAHTRRPLDFRRKEMADVCAQLKFCDLDGVDVPTSYLEGAPDRESAKSLQNARTRYFTTCHAIVSRMMRQYLGPSDMDIPLPPGPLLP